MSSKKLTPGEKVIAGALLITSFLVIITGIILYWPDRLPEPGEHAYYYVSTPFHLSLIDSSASKLLNLDHRLTLYAGKLQSVQPIPLHVIHLNSVLLILVALTGFLGTLIHIASSFTNFVGAEEFKKTWLLWYCVKPFTGTSIALVFYFVFRAGFFSSVENGGGLNIYGILSLSALAGLFTDKATLKLEEVFSVMFKPRDDRPDKMITFQIDTVKPDALKAQGLNHITIKGKLLNKTKVLIKMDQDQIQNPAITENAINFDYMVPAASQTAPGIHLSVVDEQEKQLYEKTIPVTAG